MKTGSMNNPRLKVIDEIDRIGQSGFDFIDLTFEWPSNEEFDAGKIKKRLAENNLEVVGHTSPSLPAIYPLKTVRDACIDELKRAIDALIEVGAKKINIHPFYFQGYKIEKDLVGRNIEVLSVINSYCQSRGVDLMLENFISPFDNIKIFTEIIQAVPGLKIHLDVGHINFSADFPALLRAFLERFSSTIIHCHIHDNHHSRDEHLPLGCGNIDWPIAANILKKAGYDGTFTIEVFCQDKSYLCYSKERWKKNWEQA